MKNLAITFCFTILSVTMVSSQLRFDVVGGVSPGSSPSSAGLVVNRHLPHEEFVFNMNKVDPQIFAGVKGHMELGAPFFVDAGLLYTRKKSNYDVVYTIIDTEHPVSQHTMTQTDHMIMLPVNIGANMGMFDVTSGFRLMKSVYSKTNLDQLTGFSSEGNPFELGWQAGAGFDLMRTRIGLEYQGNFSRVGKGMFINEQPLELMNVPGQFILLLSHSF